MDFGHRDDISGLHFELPRDDSRNTRAAAGGGPSIFQVYSGAPVWSCPEWVGTLYPKGTRPQDFLARYAGQMTSIELNSTFYQVPPRERVLEWQRAVPATFKFAPKFPQEISRSGLTCSKSIIVNFCKTMLTLEGNLGLSFLQMPPSFSPENIGVLHVFLAWLPKKFRLAIEFRHPHWFQQGQLIPRAFDLLAEQGAAAVITDTAGRRDVLHTSVTSPSAMIRFLGNDLHASDFTRIDQWVERLGEWKNLGIREIYFFAHHQGYTNVPELIRYFTQKMNEKYALGLKEWAPSTADQMTLW